MSRNLQGNSTRPSTTNLCPLSVNPNKSLPHIRVFLCLRPSPNSSFHFRRSVRVPKDSEDDGGISLSALLKWRSAKARSPGLILSAPVLASPNKTSFGGAEVFGFHGTSTCS